MPLRLSKDESRAVAFIGLLLALSAGARLLDRPAPVEVEGPGVDLVELEAASRRKLQATSPAPAARTSGSTPRPAATVPVDPTRTAAHGRTGLPAQPLDLNRASPEELQRLPGIGAVIATRIVAYRDSVGGFGSVEQLERVRGIGPATMRRLAPLVRVGS